MLRRLTSDGLKVSGVKSVNGLTCGSDDLTPPDALVPNANTGGVR